MVNPNDIPRLTPEAAEKQRQEAMQLRSDNPIVQAKIKEYHGLVGRIVTGFDPDKLQIENPVFPEVLFRTCGFMDFFFGFVKDNPDYDFENKWIAIAGSASIEVNIIDGSGKVLFVVPPLYDTSYLRIGNYRRDDMIGEITQNFTNRTGMEAHQYLGDALQAKLTNLIAPTSTQTDKHKSQLEQMYRYYGKRPAVETSTPGAKPATDAGKIDDDFDLD
jgi:hypothetical protein